MTKTNAAPHRPDERGLLRPHQPVLGTGNLGPRYGDSRWDFSDVRERLSEQDLFINFDTVPEGFRGTIRDVLVCLAQPGHPRLLAVGVVRRQRPVRLGVLMDAFQNLRNAAVWSATNGLPTFQSWVQADADAYLRALKAGKHRPNGVALSPETVRKHLESLYLLRELGPALPSGGFSFVPWNGQTANTVAGNEKNPENLTQPLPWETWAPLISGSYFILDRFSVDILAAKRVRDELPRRPQGPAGNQALKIFYNWTNNDGRVPLNTGFGRTSFVQRGTRNVSLLCRILGINDSIFKPANHSFNAEAYELLESMSQDSSTSSYGGLYEPTVLVKDGQGREVPWVGEIGLGEVEYLESVLRVACYVILTALTGMRDGEVQSLTKDALTSQDGIAAVQGLRSKAMEGESRSRGWWAPKPVIRAVEVLAELSPHPSLLFARTDRRKAGAYDPQRDIPRLLEFVNGDPRTRPCRGGGLGLTPIPVSKETPINATTLRRSFSIFASTHPAAELGLGIQLGHAAWRTTTGYTTNSQQGLAKLMDADRIDVVRSQAADLLRGDRVVAGPAASRVTKLRANIVTSPKRAQRLADDLAERLHLGLTNDCFYAPETASCGVNGPHLGDHVCAGSECANSLYTHEHLEPILHAIGRIDAFLDNPNSSPVFIERLRKNREQLAHIKQSLAQSKKGQSQ